MAEARGGTARTPAADFARVNSCIGISALELGRGEEAMAARIAASWSPAAGQTAWPRQATRVDAAAADR